MGGGSGEKLWEIPQHSLSLDIPPSIDDEECVHFALLYHQL